MKILYIPTLNLNCCFFRMENPAEELVNQNKHGVFVEYMGCDPRAKVSWEYMLHETTGEHSQKIAESITAAFNHFDVIVTQRIQHPSTLELIEVMKAQHPNVRVYCDLDDSVLACSQSTPKELPDAFNELGQKYLRIVDGVIVTTEVLKKEVLPFNDEVIVMHNFIRPSTFKTKKVKKDDGKVRIGYVGAAGHDQDLEAVWDELIAFIETDPKYELVIRLGGYRPSFIKDHPQLDYANMSVHISEYPQAIADLGIDVFIAPLRDLRFNRSKSDLKVIEALHFGKPIVCSDMPTFRNERTKVYEGKSVFFANKGEWGDKLKKAMKSKIKGHIKLHKPKGEIEKLTRFFEADKYVPEDRPIFGATKYKYKV